MLYIDILIMVGETLLTTVLATVFAYLLGLPCGVLLNITGKNGLKPCKWLNTAVGFIVNILRSVPKPYGFGTTEENLLDLTEPDVLIDGMVARGMNAAPLK